MKIALVGYEANVQNRVGSNQYAFELLKAIYSQDKKNDYVVFLPSQPLPDLPKEKDNWHYKIVGPRRLWNVFGLPLALFASRVKFDLVFNPGHYSPLFFPAPLVVTIMDLGYLRFPNQFTKPIYYKLKFWTWLSLKRAKYIFAISQSTKDDIIARYKVDPQKVFITYPGHNVDYFRRKRTAGEINKSLDKYNIKKPYILFLSTLKPSKNIEGLMVSFKNILALNPQFQLVIAGRKGWLFEQIFAKAKILGIENNVNFSGFVDSRDIPAIIGSSSVFVLPSFWEGFGIPVVEAMSCGVPVVVSNAGSLPEIVGQAGIVVDPYDVNDITRGITTALKNEAWLKKAGLHQAEKFTWQKCAQETLNCFEKFSL